MRFPEFTTSTQTLLTVAPQDDGWTAAGQDAHGSQALLNDISTRSDSYHGMLDTSRRASYLQLHLHT
jgi:hypothetical protein